MKKNYLPSTGLGECDVSTFATSVGAALEDTVVVGVLEDAVDAAAEAATATGGRKNSPRMHRIVRSANCTHLFGGTNFRKFIAGDWGGFGLGPFMRSMRYEQLGRDCKNPLNRAVFLAPPMRDGDLFFVPRHLDPRAVAIFRIRSC